MIPRTRQDYQDILDQLYAAIEGLDVSGYQWDSSDAWLRSRQPAELTVPLRHLEVWCQIGGIRPSRGSMLEYSGRLVIACRYQPDDDAMSQGIYQAAVYDLWRLLTTWSALDCRTSPTSTTDPMSDGSWLVGAIDFTLSIPWRP